MVKLYGLIMAALLVSFAVIQLNDPDPLFWFLLYLVAAFAPLVPKKWAGPYSWFAIGFCVAGLSASIPGVIDYAGVIGSESLIQDMSPEKPYIEEAREFIGGGIALVLLVMWKALDRWVSPRG